ncbi:MAG: NAD(+)/NADH kinase [Candidatus Omnitrophica bacterium]|nr:NAD(+)/NADH kinase [Candidatus Omnitrophota bacterium]
MASKILVVHNPKAGTGQIRLDDYLKALEARGAAATLRTLSENFNLKDALADASNFERVVVAGGDGTASAAATILQNSEIPIVIYPAGTANLLALNLKMPSAADDLAEVTVNGPWLPVDLGRLDYKIYRRRDYFRTRFGLKTRPDFLTAHFILMAGSGFVASLVSQAEPLKGRFGKAAYWWSAFFGRHPRVALFKLNIDGQPIRARGIGALVVNFEKLHFDLKVVPDSNPQDGAFEVVLLKAKNIYEFFQALRILIAERLGFKRPEKLKEADFFRGSEIEVSSWPPLKLEFDGEPLPKVNFFKVTALPRSVHLVFGSSADLPAKKT